MQPSPRSPLAAIAAVGAVLVLAFLAYRVVTQGFSGPDAMLIVVLVLLTVSAGMLARKPTR